jgi:GntR family transcriptional regulator of arabinose operon
MEIFINRDSSTPLHEQLLNQIRDLILSGDWAPEDLLPSETELQHQLKISRSTIRQALSKAEAQGLIERVPGKGTFVARSPTGQADSRLIGYISCDSFRHLQSQLLSGAESVVAAQGYRVVFCNSNRDPGEESRLLQQLVLEDKVRGILIWPVLHDDPSRRLFQLAQQDLVPLVLVDRTFKGLPYDYVTSDNYGGAYSAVEHLASLGHRRIAFLSRPILQLLTIAERLRGYQDALRSAGLTPLEPWLVGNANQEMEIVVALRSYSDVHSQDVEQIARYLESPARPTAIFAMNDMMAMQAVKAARLAGLRVPEDLSLVGFDDEAIVNTLLDVPLTTVAQDAVTLGRRAAELLIERIEGHAGPSRGKVVPTELRVRASTAPPAAIQSLVEPLGAVSPDLVQ